MKIVTIKCAFLVVLLSLPSLAGADDTVGLPHGFDAGWKGQKTCELLYETPTVRVGQCSFPPGVGHEKHFHNPHFGYVLEGASMLVRNQSGEKEVVTETGNTWSTSSVTIHEAINTGTTTARYLIVEPRPEVATRSKDSEPAPPDLTGQIPIAPDSGSLRAILTAPSLVEGAAR